MAEYDYLRNHFGVRQLDTLQDNFHAKKYTLSTKQSEWLGKLMENYDEKGTNARASLSAISFMQEVIDGKFNRKA